MPLIEIKYNARKISIETGDDNRPSLLILGPSPVQAASLPDEIKNHFNLLIPNAPFEQSPSFSTENFKCLNDFVIFYKGLLENLPQHQKVFLYGHSSLGVIALLIARDYPEYVHGVIAANSPLYDWEMIQKETKEYFDLNKNPTIYYNPSDSCFSGNYYGNTLPSPVWEMTQLQEKNLKQIKNPTYEQEYVSMSARTWKRENWAKNEGDIALSFWTRRIKLNTPLVKHFFALLSNEKPDLLSDLLQNKIKIPTLLTYGLHDGMVLPLLDTNKLKFMPPQHNPYANDHRLSKLSDYCSHTLFENAAHWSTEDPNFSRVILDWYKENFDKSVSLAEFCPNCVIP
ncbi:MAG: hypothetical protein AMJ43_02520 [Coxiella sp. DG_40]|nr:MAG: hypothetical protein AMJ43_02520 [Coxiella sp. DG_40]